MVRREYEKLALKYICLQEIGLCAQNVLTIPSSIVNMIGGGDLYDHLMNTRLFTLMTNKIFIQFVKTMRQMVAGMM